MIVINVSKYSVFNFQNVNYFDYECFYYFCKLNVSNTNGNYYLDLNNVRLVKNIDRIVYMSITIKLN